MFPVWNVPETWFLTAAHNFEYPQGSENYSFALQHRGVLNYLDKHVGKLIGVNKVHKLAVVEMNSCKINDLKEVKITYNSYIPCIRGLGIDDFDILGQTKGWNREIYKSGATTGLTNGTLSSWGVTVNPSYDDNGPGKMSEFIIVRKKNIKFSEEGDSGSTVFFVNDNNKAVVIGIVEGYWKHHLQWELSAVTPFKLGLKDWIMELNDTIVRNENASLVSEIDDSPEHVDPSKENHHIGENAIGWGCRIN
jgi:hypothetical protein